MTPPAHKNTTAARARQTLSSLALAALLSLGALMFVPSALGYQRYVVEGGSMGASIPRGSLVFDERVPPAALSVGDVITYTPPRGGLVTHRIVSIGRDRSLRTKGDANRSQDPWTFTLGGRTQARVAFHIPLAGYAYAALGVRVVRIVVLGVPALLIALAALSGLWRTAAADVRDTGATG